MQTRDSFLLSITSFTLPYCYRCGSITRKRSLVPIVFWLSTHENFESYASDGLFSNILSSLFLPFPTKSLWKFLKSHSTSFFKTCAIDWSWTYHVMGPGESYIVCVSTCFSLWPTFGGLLVRSGIDSCTVWMVTGLNPPVPKFKNIT